MATSQLPSLNELIDRNLKRGRELFYKDLEFGTETGIDEAGWVVELYKYAQVADDSEQQQSQAAV